MACSQPLAVRSEVSQWPSPGCEFCLSPHRPFIFIFPPAAYCRSGRRAAVNLCLCLLGGSSAAVPAVPAGRSCLLPLFPSAHRGSLARGGRSVAPAGCPPPAHPAGAAKPTGLLRVLPLATSPSTMGAVISGYFKPGFKSQAGSKKPVQLSSRRGMDLLPREPWEG